MAAASACSFGGKRLALSALTLLATFGFLWLGIWQIERRSWKLALIARVEGRIHAAPVAPPLRWAGTDDQDDAYRHVRVSGVLVHGAETLVQALTEQGAGLWVLTPLRTDSGVIFINRGFVPPERRDPATRASGQIPGRVTITGLLRTSEPGGGFLRRNDPASGHWYSRDIGAIAHARGINGAAPFFIDADATPNPGGYPIGGLTVIAFRNEHLLYAATWFALAILSAFGTVQTLFPNLLRSFR